MPSTECPHRHGSPPPRVQSPRPVAPTVGRPSSGLGTRACSDIAPSDAKHGMSAPSSFPTPSSAVSAPSRFNEVPELEMSRDVRHTTDGNQVPELEMSRDVRHTTDGNQVPELEMSTDVRHTTD